MIVDLKEISLCYRDEKGNTLPYIFENLNLTINEGDFYFITGPSGAGKTSILRLIYLDLKPSYGDIYLFGKKINLFSRNERVSLRRQIGVIFQNYLLLDNLNIFENVSLPLLIEGKKVEEYKNDVIKLISWVGLEDKINDYPMTLSGGEKQRVALARAVIKKPKLIIADEATGNVDENMGRKIMSLLLKFNELGTTILFATHDTHLIETYNKKTLQIKNKKIELVQ